MKQVDHLIIGGGIAGVTAAETIREKDATASILIVSDEPHRLYSRIMLSKPNFFLEKIPFNSVFLKTESWAKENDIEYIFGQSAVKLDRASKTVTLSGGEQVGYKKLLLALGCNAIRWNVSGAEKNGVHHLRTLDDAKKIIARMKTSSKAVVIGGGFIGFEMCDMLHRAGLETTLVIREKYFWGNLLDEVSGRMIEAVLKKGGVNIIPATTVTEVLGAEDVVGVKMYSGETIATDMVIVGIGAQSPTTWVAEAEIICQSGVLTNRFLQTNDPDVYAAGDVAEYEDTILREQMQYGNWVNAQLQGKTAGLNMGGAETPYHHVSFYTAHGLDTSIAFTGNVRVTTNSEVIERGSPAAGNYARILIEAGIIKGATLINRTTELLSITKLIEQKTPVEALKTQLADPTYDLKLIQA